MRVITGSAESILHYDATVLVTRADIEKLRARREASTNPQWKYGAFRHEVRLERWLTLRAAGVHGLAIQRWGGPWGDTALCVCGLAVPLALGAADSVVLLSAKGHRELPGADLLAHTWIGLSVDLDTPLVCGAWCRWCGLLIDRVEPDIAARTAREHQGRCRRPGAPLGLLRPPSR